MCWKVGRVEKKTEEWGTVDCVHRKNLWIKRDEEKNKEKPRVQEQKPRRRRANQREGEWRRDDDLWLSPVC